MRLHVEAGRDPFPHWLVDGLVPPDLCRAVAADVPAPGWPHWGRYSNDCESGKRTCCDLPRLGPAWQSLFAALGTPHVVSALAGLSGVAGLAADPTLHGAGCHVTDPGGWLNPHLDYALHPRLPGMERRLNLVLFLNDGWREEWGGAFEMLADDGATVVERVYPEFGRAVLWEPSDTAFHATQTVETLPWGCPGCRAGYTDVRHLDANGLCAHCHAPRDPEGYARWLATPRPVPRVTAAAYYLAPARPGAVRKRALFVPHRGGR